MSFHMTVADVPSLDPDDADSRALVDDAVALAAQVAPCLELPNFPERHAGVLAVLRSVIIRWDGAGTGAMTQVGEGSYTQMMDTVRARRGLLLPKEISMLQRICRNFSSGGALQSGGTRTMIPMRRVA